MPIYLYKAKDGQGKIVQGQIEAQNKQESLVKLDSRNLFLLSLEEKRIYFKRRSKVSLKELVEFTHQLSTLINSGSTLVMSLNTLVSETEQTHLKPIILEVISHVKEGAHFSDVLKKYPDIFPQLYISLVKTGETSGTLGQNLKRVAEFLEEELDFRANIISVLTYPLVIVGVGLSTIFVLLKFIIPKLVNIFEEIGQDLPYFTLILKTVSDVFSRYWVLILGLGGLLFLGFKKYFNIAQNRVKLDRFKLRLFLVGDVLKKIEISRLSRTLSILLRNGVPIDAALAVLTATVSNVFFQKQIGRIEEDIKEGLSLNEAMKKINVFPASFINVVTIGEESGRLDEVLENLSDDYNKEITRKMKNILNILEPVLILGVGLMVGFVVLAMLLPIFSIDFNF